MCRKVGTVKIIFRARFHSELEKGQAWSSTFAIDGSGGTAPLLRRQLMAIE